MIPDTPCTDPSALLNLFRQAAYRPPVAPNSEPESPFPMKPARVGAHSPILHGEFPVPHSDQPIPESEKLAHASDQPDPQLEPTPNSLNPEPSLPAAAGTLNPAKRGRPLVFDALKQHTFLRLVAVGFSTRRAARTVGVSPSTVREMAGRNMVFASGYEDAKAQAIPSLAENVYHAGQRSWRASAWLLERLRPSQFGRRVALGPDPAKRQEDQRLRQEKKQEQLDLQKPELNDQILIRCIKRLLTDPRAQEIFDAVADDLDRQAAEQAQAAGGQPQSPTNPVKDSDSAPQMETPRVSEEPAEPALAPTETRTVSEEPAIPTNAEPTQTTCCALPPSANNPKACTTDPNTETQAAQSQPPIAPSQTTPNFCALTPRAHCAEIPQAICTDKPPIPPSRPPTPSDSPRPRSVMMTCG